MEQPEFLEQHVFTDLKNLNEGFAENPVYYFSEEDFEIVLQRIEYFGIGIYKIETLSNNELIDNSTHDDFNKKATDCRWYKKAFSTFKTRQSKLYYTATYKVSNKLLARQKTPNNNE